MSGSGPNPKGKRSNSPELMSETIKTNWIDGIDPASNANELTEYVAAKCEEYILTESTDEDLHELLELDFKDWDSSTFQKVRLPTLQRLRKLLRQHGIYVERNKVQCAPAIYTAIEQPYREWKKEEVLSIITDDTFIPASGKLQYVIRHLKPSPGKELPSAIQGSPMDIDPPRSTPAKPPGVSQLPPFTPQPFLQPPSTIFPQYPPQQQQNQSGSQIATFTKLYTDEMKYSGEEPNFDFKLAIFYNTCHRACLPENQALTVFPTMLKGPAQTLYFNVIHRHPDADFQQLCRLFREHFEGEEVRRGTLDKWNSLTLQAVINLNKDKSTIECFERLLQQLRSLQHGLREELRNDYFFHNKLLTACKGIEACSHACYKPSPTIPGLISDIRSSISTHQSIHSPPSISYTTDFQPRTNFTDRKFHFSKYASSRSNLQKTQPNHRRKKCLVCHKEGCWSTNHTISEQEEAKQRYREKMGHPKNFERRYSQFLQDYEYQSDIAEDEEENFADQMETMILESTSPYHTEKLGDTDQGSSDIFLTSVGPINGHDIITDLANQSFTHALTGASNTTSPTDTEQFFQTQRYDNKEFYGVMIDTGAAARSTAGYNQYIAYSNLSNAVLDTSTAGQASVRFGIGSSTSIGSVLVHMPLGSVQFHVLKVDTPFLMSIADLDRLGVYYNNVKDVLITKTAESLPVVRRFGHPFLLWQISVHSLVQEHLRTGTVFLTEPELRRLHRRFGHPSVSRLRDILERSGHTDFDKNTIDRLTKFCHHCQIHGKSPGRFRFSLKDEINFNYTILIDVMYIDGKEILHVIDEATSFQAAKWLDNVSAKHVWDALRYCWIDMYIGPPDYILHDAGKTFVSREFNQKAASLSITTKCVPVEAHWSIGLVERYHHTLRRAYEIITKELENIPISKEMRLQMAVKSINDSAGVNGLIPTLLVFGTYPRMCELDPPAPTVAQRAAAIRKAMDEIRILRSRRQVSDALGQRNGPSTTSIHSLPLGSEVLVWREGSANRSGKWTGPFKLLGVKNETCKIELPSGPTDFRSTVVKPYHNDSKNDTNENNQALPHTPTNENPQPQMPLRSPYHFRNRNIQSHLIVDISDITEATLSCTYITGPNPMYIESRQKEINGLLEKGVFDIVPSAEAPYGTRIFNSRFVDQIKNPGTNAAFEKSRLVVQAYNDNEKEGILTQSPTIQRVSQRIILTIAAIMTAEKNYSLYLRDITQAYVQSTTALSRRIFVRPPKELELPDGMILQVIKPLYGIPEAGNHWYYTYHRHHIEKLQMSQSTYDPCLMHTKSIGFGVVGLQTDDTLFVADKEFAAKEQEKLREAKFVAKEREMLTTSTSLKFNGGIISLTDGVISLTQENHCNNLRIIPLREQIKTSGKDIRSFSIPKDKYISQRARGAYIANVCQPEASFDLSSAAQVTNPKEGDAKALNRRLQWQINNPTRGLNFVPLDKDSLQLIVFTDSSFANNTDLSSQIGYVIALTDKNNDANVIHWTSVKCKRITRSVLASELYGMALGFDVGASLKSTIENILQLDHPLPLILCTDSKSLYDCLVKLGTTVEKRLMIDLMALRQSYERREITEIRWIDGNTNPADAMTKSKPCSALKDLIDTNRISLKTAGWVERENI